MRAIISIIHEEPVHSIQSREGDEQIQLRQAIESRESDEQIQTGSAKTEGKDDGQSDGQKAPNDDDESARRDLKAVSMGYRRRIAHKHTRIFSSDERVRVVDGVSVW